MVKKIGPYFLGQSIGRGSFGEVKVGLNIVSKVRVAVKLCNKVKLSEGKGREMLEKEVATMKQLRHKNVLRVLDVMETGQCFYLVIELAEGGDLYKLLYRGRRFKEPVGLRYFQQLMQGVAYCHNRGIVHRDLKPQNLLLTKDNTLKIADFGFSGFQPVGTTHPTPRKQTATICGTPNYAAPEIFRRQGFNGFKIDVWSCGVILYFMVSGLVPFFAEKDDEGIKGIVKSVLKGEYTMPDHISEPAQDLIRKILVQDPETRPTAQEVLIHPWMCSDYDLSQQDPDMVEPTLPDIYVDSEGRAGDGASAADSKVIITLGEGEDEVEVDCDQTIQKPRGYPCNIAAFQENVEDVDEKKWLEVQQGQAPQGDLHVDPHGLSSDGGEGASSQRSGEEGRAIQKHQSTVSAASVGLAAVLPETLEQTVNFGSQHDSDGDEDELSNLPADTAGTTECPEEMVWSAKLSQAVAPKSPVKTTATRRISQLLSLPFSTSPSKHASASSNKSNSPAVSDNGDSRSCTPTGTQRLRSINLGTLNRFRHKLKRTGSPTPQADTSEVLSNGDASMCSNAASNSSNPNLADGKGGLMRRVSQTFSRDGLERERKWVRRVSQAASPVPHPHPNPAVSPKSPDGIAKTFESGALTDSIRDHRKQGLSRFASMCNETEMRTAHDYVPATLLTQSCYFCTKFIMGKGLQCRICKCPIHTHCMKEAAEHTYCEQYYFREKEDFFDSISGRFKRPATASRKASKKK
eukprot:TRINITY_DN13210_c0_g1_i1.p1 TRINITY_DN13210_c0_g1~~TRINITY_DN13210_c0_g1_i1.p1  ORF type:complete len:745 (+),score=170.22 TRINITY_DN13210_c0_g1_i1:84-2318(+)